MNVGSLFSGIGGLDHGLAQAGHRHVFFCEADPWCRDVLRTRWPGVPVYDDVRAVGEPAGRAAADGGGAHVGVWGWEAGTGLLCGGFPCQDVSVAGRRAGLAGERSGLFHEFARIIDAFRPGWVLVENVPGLLSSNGGRDFGVVLGTLADLGYGVGWRVLDSRFFGVPQRRRRVFIVGARANGDSAAAARSAGKVLAVGSRCPGHFAARGEARPGVAGTLGGGSGERGWPQDTERMTFVAAPLTKGSATGEGVNQPGRRQEDDVNIAAFHATQEPVHHHHHHHHTPAMNAEPSGAIAFALRRDPGGTGQGHNTNYVAGVGVRRLTPVECERLQGLPDGWTDLGGTPDSRRYAGLGDAVTSPVAEWIGRRLAVAA